MTKATCVRCAGPAYARGLCRRHYETRRGTDELHRYPTKRMPLKERAEQILSLRATGMSDRQIAHRIGYTNTDSVRGAVHVARKRGLIPPHEGNLR